MKDSGRNNQACTSIWFEVWGGHESGFENGGGAVGPKSSTDGGTYHMIEGIIPGVFIRLCTNYSTCEKSPLWNVLLSHTPVYYRI